MAKVTFNERPLRKGDLEKALMEQALAAAKEEMHDRVGSIRHPDTEEFPTVRVLGDSLDDMRMQIEGSPELLERIGERLNDEERKAATFMPAERIGPPTAFLSFSFGDKELAEQIAKALMAKGIDTWWAGWEIQSGDSLRQKIDSGLDDCSHFIVLLTPGSLTKPWVQQEMDAGLVRKIGGEPRRSEMLNADTARYARENAGDGHVTKHQQCELRRNEVRTEPDNRVLVAAQLDLSAPNRCATDLTGRARRLRQQDIPDFKPEHFALARREVHLQQVVEVQS